MFINSDLPGQEVQGEVSAMPIGCAPASELCKAHRDCPCR